MTVPAILIASVAAQISGWPSPLEAVAETLIEWTPVSLANVILDHMGSTSRPAALLGALAIVMVMGGIAGAFHAAGGRTLMGQVAGIALAGTFLGEMVLNVVRPVSAPPVIWFIGAFLTGLVLLSGSHRTVSGRATMLARTGTILGGAMILVALFTARPLFNALSPSRLFPYRRPDGLPVVGLTDLVTTSDNHYIMDKVLQAPVLTASDWTLAVYGEVRHPLTLDYGSLLQRPSTHRYITMECVDNPIGGSLISTCLWTGVRVSDLLRNAGARGETIVFHGADGYAEGIPAAALERAGAMIAFGMNGEVLRREHGYPARLIFPGYYGFKSVKWLDRIHVTHGSYGDEWQSHGWTPIARIHTTTRIDIARRTGDNVLVAGIAFAGTRGIRAVEVRANGGPWQRATLGPALSPATWVQWAVRLRGPGPAGIEARAIDGRGTVQSEQRHDAQPDGATGWASVTA